MLKSKPTMKIIYHAIRKQWFNSSFTTSFCASQNKKRLFRGWTIDSLRPSRAGCNQCCSGPSVLMPLQNGRRNFTKAVRKLNHCNLNSLISPVKISFYHYHGKNKLFIYLINHRNTHIWCVTGNNKCLLIVNRILQQFRVFTSLIWQ